METVGTTASHEASFPTTLHPSGNRWRAACDIHLINVNVPTRAPHFGVRATIKLQLDLATNGNRAEAVMQSMGNGQKENSDKHAASQPRARSSVLAIGETRCDQYEIACVNVQMVASCTS